MGDFFVSVCEHHGIPLAINVLGRNLEIVDYLYTPVSVVQFDLF